MIDLQDKNHCPTSELFTPHEGIRLEAEKYGILAAFDGMEVEI